MGQDGGTLGNRISLTQRDQVSRTTLETLPVPFPDVRTQGERGGTGTPPCWHPHLRLPASTTLRNKFMCWFTIPPMGFCPSRPKGPRQIQTGETQSHRFCTQALARVQRCIAQSGLGSGRRILPRWWRGCRRTLAKLQVPVLVPVFAEQ